VRLPPATLPILHCASRARAEAVLAGIAQRMNEVGLRLHPDKTRIVYCKDSNRRGEHEHISFTFLGFAFRPREALGRGVRFTSFLPAISPEALKAKHAWLRAMRIHMRTDLTVDGLAPARECYGDQACLRRLLRVRRSIKL
jgi:RNA-directed DNA polymerase